MENENTKTANEGEIEVKLRLEIDFTTFTKSKQREFLNDLAYVAGCPAHEIEILSIERGCVIVRLKLPEKSARKLLKDYMESQGGVIEAPEFKAFLEKYSIDQLLEQQQYEVFMTVKKPASGKALLFVHGWNGDQNSFGIMPDTLSSACKCDSYIYRYPSGLLKHSPSLAFTANDLANWVKNHIGNKKLAILCHSMGGLLTRRFILNESQSNKSRFDLNIRTIMFFASPHNGVSYASIGKRIIGLSTEQMRELDPNSPMLFQLNTEWPRWVDDHVPNDCRLNSIFGTKDTTVSFSSSIGLSEETVSLTGKDHINIVKPVSLRDEINLTAWRFLREAHFAEIEIPK